jgi:hypothetical protein
MHVPLDAVKTPHMVHIKLYVVKCTFKEKIFEYGWRWFNTWCGPWTSCLVQVLFTGVQNVEILSLKFRHWKYFHYCNIFYSEQRVQVLRELLEAVQEEFKDKILSERVVYLLESKLSTTENLRNFLYAVQNNYSDCITIQNNADGKIKVSGACTLIFNVYLYTHDVMLGQSFFLFSV